MYDAVARLFRWRVSTTRRRKIIAGLQAFAAKYGRSPTVQDMNYTREAPYTLLIYKSFKSIPDALRAAGLEPNKVGAKSHKRNR